MSSRISRMFVLAGIVLAGPTIASAGPKWIIKNAPQRQHPVLLAFPPDDRLSDHQPGDRVLLEDEKGRKITGQLERIRPDQPDLHVLALLPAGLGNIIAVDKIESPSSHPRYSTIHSANGLITLLAANKPMAVYHLDVRKIPGNEKYNQSNFFHPLYTPTGIVVTDDAPPDHLHHRGLFLTFTKVIGPGRDGKPTTVDFWHPHKRARIAPGKLLYLRNGDVAATFAATHNFLIDDQPILTQTVIAAASQVSDQVNLLDLSILITAVTDNVTLGDNFYSCLQLRGARKYQNAQLVFTYADGKKHHDVDAHKEDPPTDRWFDMTGTIDNRLAGATIASHADTPTSRLCYARGVKGINADFVYDAPIPLKKGQTLTCKYQIYIHDNDVAAAGIAELGSWYNPGVQIAKK